LSGIPSDFSDNTDNVDDADNDPSNEIELPGGGINGQFLQTDGAGTTIWADPSIGSIGSIEDVDGDTRIQLQHIADDDAIHFVLDSVEYFTMDGPRLEIYNSGMSIFIGDSTTGKNDDLSTNSNIAIGHQALSVSTNTYASIAVGDLALKDLTSGGSNVAIGSNTSSNLMDGGGNTSLGASSMRSISTGDQNTMIGHYAGRNLVAGDKNVIIGPTSIFGGGLYSQNGSVKIGFEAGRNDSTDHVLHIANRSNQSLISGNFDLETVRIDGALSIRDHYTFPTNSGVFGQYLQTNGSGTTAWSDLLLRTDLGIGTLTPISEVHIKGSDSQSELTIAPSTTVNGDTSSIFLAEDHDGTFGMSIMYDGDDNKMKVFGKSSATTYGPHLVIDRGAVSGPRVGIGDSFTGFEFNVEGDTRISEYTQLGSDAPKIKMKKLTGTTGAFEGGQTSVLHDLADISKILSVNVVMQYSSTEDILFFPHTKGFGWVEKEYSYYVSEDAVSIRLQSTNSADIVNTPFRILITYEE
jgi:hypothetical protein